MELTLMQFSMRRNWHAVNDTNRFFYTYSPGLDAYQEFAIAPGTYYTFDELAAAVQAALRAVAGYGASICVYDDPSRCLLMEMAGNAADEYICSFQVKSGLRPTGVSAAGFFSDVHELLGIIPSRTPTPVNGQGGAVGPGEQTMPFPAQLNTLEGIYVRTNLNSGNFMSFGYNRNLPDANSLVESNIMARIPLNTQAYDPTYPFVTYQDGGAEIFKLHLPRKSLDTITFIITDDKDRPLSQVSPGQAALGLLSYNMVLRWDHLSIASARLSNHHKNTTRLDIISSSVAGPGTQTTVQLPSNALIDLKSFRMYANVECVEGLSGPGGITAYGRLPEHSSYLISRVEVAMNAIQLNTGYQEYNTAMKIKRTVERSRDFDGSIDRALQHGAISNANANETARLVWADWTCCFIGSCATQYIDTGLTGEIVVRLTWAPASVIVPKVNGVNFDDNFGGTPAAVAAAALVTYKVSDIYFDIATVSVDDVYPNMLRQQLARDGVIEIPYNEYLSFNLDSINSTSLTHQVTLSTRSLDKMYATLRSANYNTRGVRVHKLPNVTLGDGYASNYLRFRSFDTGDTARFQWRVCNTPNPLYDADNRWALAEVAHMADKHGEGSDNLITSYECFMDGQYIAPLTLCMPGTPPSLTSGLDLRGVSATVNLRMTGLTLPAVDVAAQIPTQTISCYILAETKPLLKIAPGRVCAVDF